jgi:hypothetical protein
LYTQCPILEDVARNTGLLTADDKHWSTLPICELANTAIIIDSNSSFLVNRLSRQFDSRALKVTTLNGLWSRVLRSSMRPAMIVYPDGSVGSPGLSITLDAQATSAGFGGTSPVPALN